MKTRIWLAWFYRLTIQVVFNILFNGFHLLRIVITGRLHGAFCALKIARYETSAVKLMTYKYDGITKGDSVLGKWPCWTALPLVFADMGLSGNCMDGAYFFKRLFRSGRVRVWLDDGPKWLHTVHYVYQSDSGVIYSLGKSGVKIYKSLAQSKRGGVWL